MELVDPDARSQPLPPPTAAGPAAAELAPSAPGAVTAAVTAEVAVVSTGAAVSAPPKPDAARGRPFRPMVPMLPWRVGGAVALSAAFVLIGWQVQRLVDDQEWSDQIMWGSIAAGLAAAGCVLGWTWFATTNARRLVEPATNRQLPDPRRAVGTWLVPFAFVAVAVGVVAVLGENANRDADDPASSVPLAVAVVCLLIAIPLTYRPLHYLSGMVRQVGGHSANLARWMWVPVVLGVVGIGSIVALRVGGAVSDSSDNAVDTASQWAPLWVLGVVAIAPCVIVVLLAWRAAGSVEEAIAFADDRRRRSVDGSARATANPRALPVRAHPSVGHANRGPVRLIPGADLLRLCMVTLLAGLALLTIIGAVVMFMFWSESVDGVLLPSQRERAWDAFGVLQSGARIVGFALIAVAAIWTFLAVMNVRMASGRRRNPLIAGAAWPIAAIGVWILADRFVIDQSAGSIVVGFALQAAVLYVPFAILERSADAVDARRTPLRITYMFGVVLLVYVQALGGLTTIEETASTANYGRLAGFLAVGALIQLLTTLAVTEACRMIENATERDAEHHNSLVGQREALAQRAMPRSARPPHVGSSSVFAVPAASAAVSPDAVVTSSVRSP